MVQLANKNELYTPLLKTEGRQLTLRRLCHPVCVNHKGGNASTRKEKRRNIYWY